MAGTLQTLISISGNMTGQSDPVTISANPVILTIDPTVTSSGIAVVAATNQEILAAPAGDTYVYVRNTGAAGAGTGNGIVDLTSTAGVVMASLRVGDVFFAPIKSGLGVKVKYNATAAADTFCVYATFTVKV